MDDLRGTRAYYMYSSTPRFRVDDDYYKRKMKYWKRVYLWHIKIGHQDTPTCRNAEKNYRYWNRQRLQHAHIAYDR